jgi:hypothetical protein
MVAAVCLAVGFGALQAPRAWAEPFTVFNTGVDAMGAQLPPGALDLHWFVAAGPGITMPVPAVVVNNQSPLGLYAQSPNSRWVWVNASGQGGSNVTYTLRLTFDLTGFDASTAVLSGAWGVDNSGQIRLNGAAPVGTGTFALSGFTVNNFNQFYNFTITGGFVPGLNTLDVVATDADNLGAVNVTNLAGTAVATAVPEPMSVVMLAVGTLGLSAYGWRRRKGTVNPEAG